MLVKNRARWTVPSSSMHNAEVQSIPDSVSPKHPPKKPTGWKQFNSANTQYPNIPIKKKKNLLSQ